MHFINSAFLFFIPLVLIPFVIHFLFFKKQKKEFFSSLFLIKRAYLKNRNLIRFKKYLIFILRFLIVLLLVAAFAKPVIKPNKIISKMALGTNSEESVKLLVLIDRSYSNYYSLSGKTVYDVSAGAALKILKSLGKNDKAAVAFFSEEMETKHLNWTDDFSSLENIIKTSKPSFKGTDYAVALNKAYEFFLNEHGGKKVILMVSDLSQHGFRNPSWKLKDISHYDKEIILLGTYFKGTRKNGFIKKLSIPDETKAELTARIIASEKNIKQKVILSEGFLKEERTFDILEDGKRVIKFILPEKKKNTGYERCGSVALKEDKLPIDDKFFYALGKPYEPVKTLLLYSNPKQLESGHSAYFLKKLLHDSSSINLKVSDVKGIDKDELKKYQLIICIGQKTATALKEPFESFVVGGGKLLFIPSSLNKENQRPFLRNYDLKPGNEKTGHYSLKPALERDFFKKNNFTGFEFNKILIKKFLNISEEEKNILWHFSNEKADYYPALISKRYGAGAISVFTSSFDVSWSDMALKPVFADFIFSFIRFFSSVEPVGENKSMIYIGQKYKTNLTSLYSGKLKISGPQNKIYFEHPQNGSLIFEQTQIPGIYSWKDSAGRDRCFVVNVDRGKGESVMDAANTLVFAHIGLDEPLSDFNSAVYGAQLWRLLLLICGLFFITEGILSEKL